MRRNTHLRHPLRARTSQAGSLSLGGASLVGFGAGACILFALGSLMLANRMLAMQNERAHLRSELETRSREVLALRLEAVERQSLDALKQEADRLGLVSAERVTFFEDDGRHLTQQ
jgi:hypothetical protein